MSRIGLVVFALLALSLTARGAVAQTGLQIDSNTAQVDFPNGVIFTLSGSSDEAPSDVRVNYQVAPDGVEATTIASCTGGESFTCTARLVSGPGNLLIPGAEITYSWTLTIGDTAQGTPEQTVTYEDTRFDWKTLTQGNMTLWYYSGSEEDARDVLDAAYTSEQDSSALLQTTVDYPVKVFYYGSAQDMQLAIQSDNDEGVITLGEVVYSDTAMIAADASPKDIARHEIAHVVQRAALTGPYNAPDWVIEGMAVYMQSEPLDGQRNAIESAIESNTVLSVRSMSSASSGAISGNVFLYYGESWSLVKFLIDTYGEQKFADYFRTIEAGAGEAGALQQVYGFNQDGLENAWRGSVGLPPRSAPTPGDNDGEPSNTNSQAENTDDTNIVLIIGIIAITVAMASALLAVGFVLARRLR